MSVNILEVYLQNKEVIDEAANDKSNFLFSAYCTIFKRAAERLLNEAVSSSPEKDVALNSHWARGEDFGVW